MKNRKVYTSSNVSALPSPFNCGLENLTESLGDGRSSKPLCGVIQLLLGQPCTGSSLLCLTPQPRGSSQPPGRLPYLWILALPMDLQINLSLWASWL